jgi:hypothetical protein
VLFLVYCKVQFILIGFILFFPLLPGLIYPLDSPSSSTLLLIFHTITKLVNFDMRYKNILRESGLLDMLVKLLMRGYDQIKGNTIGISLSNIIFIKFFNGVR